MRVSGENTTTMETSARMFKQRVNKMCMMDWLVISMLMRWSVYNFDETIHSKDEDLTSVVWIVCRLVLIAGHYKGFFRIPQVKSFLNIASRKLHDAGRIPEVVRPMLHHIGYPLELWGEAALTACYILNRLPTSALVSGMTPFKSWRGYKPDVSHLCRWGCVAYAHIPEELRKKLDPKGKKGILVGYDNPLRTYRIYDPVARGIISMKDWIVSENEIWNFGTVTEPSVLNYTFVRRTRRSADRPRF